MNTSFFLCPNPEHGGEGSTRRFWERYDLWSPADINYLFTCRSDPREASDSGTVPISELKQAGFNINRLVTAQQPHSNEIAVVREPIQGEYPAADALVTNLPQTTLLVRVADCGPVYFYDPQLKVVGLAHSGKKGTALNIVHETISCMSREYGCEPRNLSVFLGPCIRPPHYEVDFARTIGDQARAAGVLDYRDSGICTASNLSRYYSYRAEKGQTGRMWAALMLVGAVL